MGRKPAKPCAATVSGCPLFKNKWAESGQMAIKMGKNNSLIPQKRPNPAIKVGRSPFFQTKVGRNIQLFRPATIRN
ncbi:hypothetical protein, partial [uncultured Oscillibacter sp.]|uniref:hypothetical protein n=1 Tax=uncultured Oscillibacter sp. TaxID=876091 RepID=UPI00272B0D09